MRRIILLLIGFYVSTPSFSQFRLNGVEPFYDKATKLFLFSISEGLWGKEWIADVEICEDSNWETITIDGVAAGQGFVFKDIEGGKSYQIEASTGEGTKAFRLQFTYLPILHFESGLFGREYVDDKAVVQADGVLSEVMDVKVKWRGGTTNGEGKNKRNYKVKCLDGGGGKMNRTFFGLRSDNTWILDAGQVDLFRVRNLIAAGLWQDFATGPYYMDKEPKALTATRGRVVEVFLNKQYQGIFSLCEPIDRKQMRLKKYSSDGTIHGGLWKASGYGDATFWNIPDEYDSTKEKNDIWELKYPEIEDLCPSDYSTLWNAIMFTASSSDREFNEHVKDYFDMPVLTDYYLFAQVTNGFDICGKNVYWAVYDKVTDKRLTLAMWDLDCTMGQNYRDNPLHPDYVGPTYPLLSPNRIFYQLVRLNTDNFNKKVEWRYAELREGVFATDSLRQRYIDAFNMLEASGAAGREEQRWSYDSDISGLRLNFREELDYICEWIGRRMEFLDGQFAYTPTAIPVADGSREPSGSSAYTLQGTKAPENYRGIVIRNGKLEIRR